MTAQSILTLIFAASAILSLYALVQAVRENLRLRNEAADYQAKAVAEVTQLRSEAAELERSNVTYRHALQWYADRLNWTGREHGKSIAFSDRGAIARGALLTEVQS